MAIATTTTPETAESNSTQSTPAAKPDFFQKLVALFRTPKKTGVYCEHCDWSGPTADVFKAPRLNEDGKVYMISACPRCMRNGGLEFYD